MSTIYSFPSPFSGPPPNISFASRFASPARASHAFSSRCVDSCRTFRCSALSLNSWDLAQRRSACNVTHLGESIRPFSRSFDCAFFNGLEAPVTSTFLHPLSTRLFFGPTHPRLPDLPGLYLVVNSTHCKTGGCALQFLDFWTTLFDERTIGEGGNRS